MAPQAEDALANIEARLGVLETAVARLNSILEPGFSVANMAAPVATAWLKEAAQHEFSAKFFALLDVGEALLKYSAAVAFAWVLQVGKPQAAEVIEMFKQPPTLGKLADGLRKILDDPSNADWPLDVLREAFRRPNGKPTPVSRYLLDEFISIRNEQRGHGAQQPEGHYEGLYLRNYLTIQDCVRDCRHLQLPLLQVHAVDILGGHYAYQTTLLMGGSPARAPEPVVTPVRMRPGSTCVWDRGIRVLPVQDFVTYRYCGVCGLEHVFFAERRTDKKVSYHSYTGNHRIVVERTGT